MVYLSFITYGSAENFLLSHFRDKDLYNILSVWNNDHRIVVGDSGDFFGHTEPLEMAGVWELVIPHVTVPPGWLKIRNMGSGDLLSHKYLHSHAKLLPPPASPKASQHRESWGIQWALVHAGADSLFVEDGDNKWRIINRLTGGFLWDTSQDVSYGCGVCPHTLNVWSLELHLAGDLNIFDRMSRSWTIVQPDTFCLLQSTDVPFGEGKRVAAVEKTFTSDTKDRKRWEFM